MSGFWVIATGDDAVAGTWGRPWACQLIHAELTDVAIVIDLVALEPGADTWYRCGAGAPFAVTIRLPAAMPRELRSALQSWADSGDVLAVATGNHAGSRWLSLSTGEQNLVVELVGAQ